MPSGKESPARDQKLRLKATTDSLEQEPAELKSTLDTILRGEYQAEQAKIDPKAAENLARDLARLRRIDARRDHGRKAGDRRIIFDQQQL